MPDQAMTATLPEETDRQDAQSQRSSDRPPVEKVHDHDVGVHIGRDRHLGKFRIRLSPDMPSDDFIDMMQQEIKPLLYVKHLLKGEDGKDGPEVYFHFNKEERDWEIQYRFVRRENGEPVKDGNGKTQYDYYTNQVEHIARRTAESIAALLNKKLGRQSDEQHIPF